MSEERHKIRELDLSFMNELFPKPEWDWSINPVNRGGAQAWAIHVHHARGACTAHAFVIDEIPQAAQRAKDSILLLPAKQ